MNPAQKFSIENLIKVDSSNLLHSSVLHNFSLIQVGALLAYRATFIQRSDA